MSKAIPSTLQSHLDSGATTLCHCWRLTRKDSTVLGFTEHDKDLVFDGTTFKADSGFTASTFMASIGLAVDNLTAYGALDSAAITESDIAAGKYDNASVEIFLVNWSNTSDRMLLLKGTLGEVTRGEYSFEAEMRSLSHRLQQQSGRIYQRTCDAELGDTRCGVVVPSSTCVVTAITDNRILTVTGLTNDTGGYYSYGRLILMDGSSAAIKRHTTGRIELWTAPRQTITVGSSLLAYAGCDKVADTCKDKFSNIVNFRGFNFIPGDTFVTKYVTPNTEADGGSRYG